ncbi:peptidoglycan-recognition protein LB-like [Ctenocephalides felis]|uniref:peptidoglycan-recognition protein LB-like n=1 Tax=Ctenocephalides felis TaxID=7515 RepID=UPI000E6E27F2|nr:peptidoglycan-recognition protein LB-like [Ctenocephalides felis]
MVAAAPLLLNLLTIANAASTCPIVTRAQWGAKPPTNVQHITSTLSHVIIHHSVSPGPCGGSGQATCASAMKSMQNYHQQTNGWADIGYSFAVGGDGKIYQGRGWKVVGAHAPGYNFNSVGICLIGNWSDKLPSQAMLTAVKNLISCGVAEGHLKKDYVLLGHRQAVSTECPGNKLYAEISTWPHKG